MFFYHPVSLERQRLELVDLQDLWTLRSPFGKIVVNQLSLVWWFQTFFIFYNIWDNPSHWLIFFNMVKTTNQFRKPKTWEINTEIESRYFPKADDGPASSSSEGREFSCSLSKVWLEDSFRYHLWWYKEEVSQACMVLTGNWHFKEII